jgi:hypothetical protein
VGKSDPYAKVYLVGDGTQFTAEDKHIKTKTHKNNLNPEFNEIFKFKVVNTVSFLSTKGVWVPSKFTISKWQIQKPGKNIFSYNF